MRHAAAQPTLLRFPANAVGLVPLEPKVQDGRFPGASGASRWDAHNSAVLVSNPRAIL